MRASSAVEKPAISSISRIRAATSRSIAGAWGVLDMV